MSTGRVEYTLACVLMVLWLGTAKDAPAQGIERPSMTGEQAAASLKGSDSGQPYNLRIGPVSIRADTGITTTFNDNINLANTGRQTDLIFSPLLNLNAFWQATELNNVTFNMGIGYAWYTMHSNDNTLVISPDSQTKFNVFIGDVKVSFYDDFSFEQDPIAVGQLSNTDQFARFLNDVGFQADWDLNDLVVTGIYNHRNLWVFSDAFRYLTYQADTITPKVTFHLSPTLDAGLQLSVSEMEYDEAIQNNNKSVSAGPFASAQLSEFLSVFGQAGWYYTEYDQGGLNGDSSNINSFYFSGGVNHRVNDFINESLTVGREFMPGVTSNYTQRYYANYTASWQATTYLSSSANLWWENLEDSNASIRETADRYGVGLSLNYNLTEKASVNATYQYVLKEADPSVLNYYQDVAILGFKYQF